MKRNPAPKKIHNAIVVVIILILILCIYIYIMTLGMWGSPRDEALDHWQCEKIPLFALFSCHRQLIFMLLLCEHMSCMLASR